MKLLLDTHVLLWALEDSFRLPFNIRDMIISESNEIYVSAVSLWEIAIKHKKQPELMPYSAEQIRDYCQRSGYIFLSVNLDSVVCYEKFDFLNHKDPFDQMLVTQSACHNMRFLTHDEKIKSLGIGFVEYF